MKFFKFLLTLFLSLSVYIKVEADENIYTVNDLNTNLNQVFDNYDQAFSYYNNNLDNYDNLVLAFNGKVIDMEYGIVEFRSDDSGLISYYSIDRNSEDYLSGIYGIDAAYIKCIDNNVYFKVAGDVGYTDIKNVILHPINELSVSISSYKAKDGYLYHNIKTQLDYEYYSKSLCIDYVPSFLDNNKTYYSYDGHYFYDDFRVMVDDYRNNTFENAVNDDPYYNYFQYLPYRSLTNYEESELEDYFYNTLGIDGRLNKYIDLNNDNSADEINRSQMYGNINEFFNNQFMYGTNALMLIGAAVNDSSYGRSLNSYISNNLYLNAAYESELEKNNDRYNSIANSIYSYSKYFISKLYSNYLSEKYSGTYFGNKFGGINIEYSLDQYYGEKCASEVFKIDNALNSKDYNSHCIAIIDNTDLLYVYNDSQLSNMKISIKNVNELSYVVLEEYDNSYKVQLDQSFNSEYLYDFSNSVGYICKDDISYVLNKDKISEYELNKVNFDFKDGNYHDYNSLSIKTNVPINLNNMVPSLDGYEFVEYEQIENDNGNIVYVPKYKRINEIEAKVNINNTNLSPIYNLTNDRLTINYEDSSKKTIEINTDYISNYDPTSNEVQTITVSYNGFVEEKNIQFKTGYYEEYNELIEALNNEDYDYVKENIGRVSAYFDFDKIKSIDYIIKKNNDRNYVITDNTGKYDISFSGLDLSLDDRKNFHLIEDTYYVIINETKSYNTSKIESIAGGYGFEIVDSLNIDFRFNYQKLDLRGPVVVQVNVEDKQNDYIYSIYHLNKNGDVIKCRTTQSDDYIQFEINEKGDYVILKMPSMNIYNIENQAENLSYKNVGADNNQINIEFMLGVLLILLSLAGIIIYYRYIDVKEREWKDYRKSLLKADTVQEEKQKN